MNANFLIQKKCRSVWLVYGIKIKNLKNLKKIVIIVKIRLKTQIRFIELYINVVMILNRTI
jgi:hypothetical protein